MNRPARLVVVVGTGTEVGKTWVGAQLAGALRARGARVAARKPVQSYANGSGRTDADVLAEATGEPVHAVCHAHRWYAAPFAPPMAAQAVGAPPFTIGDLVAELDWSNDVDVGIVEGAGGLRSPLASDGDNLDLVHELRPETVVLVADAELGTINAVRLSVAALDPYSPIVVLNRFDQGRELHRRNLEWLATCDGFEVSTTVTGVAARVLGERRGA